MLRVSTLFGVLSALLEFYAGVIRGIEEVIENSPFDVDVSVEEGELPEVDAEVGSIETGTETETVEVPDVDVDVDTQEAEVEVPTIDVNPPEDDS